jgi:hypothetical protein
MPPSPRVLVEKHGLERPVVGFYDAPDPAAFQPCESPSPLACLFAFYDRWVDGRTLHLDQDNCGCPGAALWLFGLQSAPDDELARRLVDVEGIKEDYGLMAESLKTERRHVARFRHALIGPLRDSQWPYLRTVTFFVDADQLSALVMGAEYHRGPGGVTPVVVPSGPGCMKLMPFADPDVPQAAIGGTDIGVRRFLPHDVLAFTVTRSMFAGLCRLDQRSFLFKDDLIRMQASRRFERRTSVCTPSPEASGNSGVPRSTPGGHRARPNDASAS